MERMKLQNNDNNIMVIFYLILELIIRKEKTREEK
jgi:hypothetical protein